MSKKSITLTLTAETHTFIATIAQQHDATLNEVARYLLMKGLACHTDELLESETDQQITYKQAVQQKQLRQHER